MDQRPRTTKDQGPRSALRPATPSTAPVPHSEDSEDGCGRRQEAGPVLLLLLHTES